MKPAKLTRSPTSADLEHIAREAAKRHPMRASDPGVIGRGPAQFWPLDPAITYRADYLLLAARELLRFGLTDTTGLERTPTVVALEAAWALLRATEETDR